MLRRRHVAVATTLAFVAAAIVTLVALNTDDGLEETFDQPNGLITNEWAHHHRDDPHAIRSKTWRVTAGSLFADNGTGTNGTPDRSSVDPTSSTGTGSAVFRMVSKRRNFTDTEMNLEFVPLAWARTTESETADDWAGFHVFARYRSENQLYAVSLLRKDNLVTIKKKTPDAGGDNGTYATLAQVAGPPLSFDQTHRATIRVTGDDPAEIDVSIDGKPVLHATDAISPLAGGRVGIRSDDLRFSVDNISVKHLGRQ